MAGSVNKAVLIGRVGKDPTVRFTQDNRPIASFSMATSNSWRDKASGERKEETQWHNIVVFNTHFAEIAEKFVKKGAHLYIEGEIKNRKWQDKTTGQDRYITEIVVPAFGGSLQLLTPQSSNQAPPREEERTETRQATRTDPRGNPQYSGGDLDEEVSF